MPRDLIGLGKDEFQKRFDAESEKLANELLSKGGAVPSRREFEDAVVARLQAGVQREPSWTDAAVTGIARVGAPLAIGIGTGLLSANPVAGYAAGAASSGLGERLAQMYEKSQGLRDDYNNTQTAVQTVLGGLPMGKIAGKGARLVAGRMVQGGAMGGLGAGATEAAETGELPHASTVLKGTLLGGALGGGLGGFEARKLAQRDARVSVRPGVVEPDEVMPPPAPAGPKALPSGRFVAGPGGIVPPGGIGPAIAGADPLATDLGTIPMQPSHRPTPPRQLPAGTVGPTSQMGQAIAAADPLAVLPGAYRPRAGQPLLPLPRGQAPTPSAPTGAVPTGRLTQIQKEGGVSRKTAAQLAQAEADTLARQNARTLPPMPDTSFVRSYQLAPVAQSAVDPATQMSGRVPDSTRTRVTQFSMDPNATPAPLVDPELARYLRAMADDMDDFRPESPVLVDKADPNANFSNESRFHRTEGSSGSPLYDDFKAATGFDKEGGREFQEAIEDVLAGKPIKNRKQQIAVHIAESLAGRRENIYRGPAMPIAQRFAMMSEREAAERAAAGGWNEATPLQFSDDFDNGGVGIVQPGSPEDVAFGNLTRAQREAVFGQATGQEQRRLAVDDFEAFDRLTDDIMPVPDNEHYLFRTEQAKRVLISDKASKGRPVEVTTAGYGGQPDTVRTRLTRRRAITVDGKLVGYMENTPGSGSWDVVDTNGKVLQSSHYENENAARDIFDPLGGWKKPRVPGEEGFVRPDLLLKAGLSGAGALAGFASGDTTDERITNAFLGAGLGAGAGVGASRLAGKLVRPAAVAATKAAVTEIPGTQQVRRPLNPTQASREAMGTPRTDPMEGVDKLLNKFHPDERAALGSMLSKHATDFDQQRRGQMNVEQFSQLASEIAVVVNKRLPKGSAATAEQITAYAKAASKTLADVQDAAAALTAKGVDATDMDKAALARAQVSHEATMASLMGLRSEAGRALGVFNLLDRAMKAADPTLVAKFADKFTQEQREFLAEMAKFKTPVEQYRFMQSRMQTPWRQKLLSYYYANILSGVKTHERNIIGNAASMTSRFLTTPVAAGIDAMRNPGQRSVYLGELSPQFTGMVAGVQQGVKDFLHTMRWGVSPTNLKAALEGAQQEGQFDSARFEFSAPGGADQGLNPFNWPGRALDAADAFFRSAMSQSELYARAWSQAKSEGLTGEALLNRAATLRATDDNVAAAMLSAKQGLFQRKSGPIASWLQVGKQKAPLTMGFLMPFIKTPANIMYEGMRMSPLGFATEGVKAAGREGAQSQAMAVAGSLAAIPIAMAAASGILTGSGPRDRAKREEWLAAGNRPNSVKIGDTSVDISLFQPISVQALAIANAFDVYKNMGTQSEFDAATILEKTGVSAMMAGRSMLDQSFLSGVYDFMQAIENPERFGSTLLGRTAHSLTPFAGAQRTAVQATDPVVREDATMTDVFKANVPGLSSTVEPKIDRFGQQVTRPQGPVLPTAVDPFNMSTMPPDRVSEEMARLGVRIGLPTVPTLGEGRGIIADELGAKQRKGQTIHDAVERLVNQPLWDRLSDEAQRNILKRTINRARTRADAITRREAARNR